MTSESGMWSAILIEQEITTELTSVLMSPRPQIQCSLKTKSSVKRTTRATRNARTESLGEKLFFRASVAVEASPTELMNSESTAFTGFLNQKQECSCASTAALAAAPLRKKFLPHCE